MQTMTGERAARAVWSHLVEPGDPVGHLDGSAQEALELLRSGGLEGDLATHAARWKLRLEGLDEDVLAGRFDRDLRFLIPDDEDWPKSLADLGTLQPIGLWMRGEASILSWPSVSIVGARAATSYGQSAASEMAGDLAATHVLVSGGAYGIDAAVHRATLARHGRTVVVLAGGIDRVYPAAHRELVEAIVVSGGAVVSEMPPGATPARHRFLSRNRLIAALGQATVVVEAGVRSGALSTARHAAEIGRDVAAVPGPITSAASAGTNQLLRDFGICVTGAQDVRELLGAIGPDTLPRVAETVYDRLGERDRRVWNALTPRVVGSLTGIAREAGLSAHEAATSLSFLQSIGLARSIADRWIRVAV